MATKKRWAITTDQAREDALKCTMRSEFEKRFSGSYRHLMKKGFYVLDDACKHMTGYTQWNTKKCVDVARTCKTRGEFKKHTGAYCHSSENNLFDLCYAHMGPPEKVGKKISQKTIDRLEKEKNCVHKWQKINLSWGVYNKCLKCRISVKVEKTQVEKIADLIKSKIAR